MTADEIRRRFASTLLTTPQGREVYKLEVLTELTATIAELRDILLAILSTNLEDLQADDKTHFPAVTR